MHMARMREVQTVYDAGFRTNALWTMHNGFGVRKPKVFFIL